MASGVLCLALLATSCGKSADEPVRASVRTFGGGDLKKDQVTVENLQPLGNQATAEVTIRTAVKMNRINGQWVIDEFRIGDRRWIKVADFLAALNHDRVETAQGDLAEVVEGISSYRQASSSVPQEVTFEALVDRLTPRYLKRVIRNDPWFQTYRYQPLGGESFDLRSAGPDGKFETADDVVAEKK